MVDTGGSASIDTNTITGNQIGILAQAGGCAQITNNIITTSTTAGIVVEFNSSAFIGVNHPTDTVVQPNDINTSGQGVVVENNSTGTIIGNKIHDNTSNGVLVKTCSHADIAYNTINNNGIDGIMVAYNSGVNLGESIPGLADFAYWPNDTTKTNGLYGIQCTVGGYIAGYQGTLTGVKGPVNVSLGCVKSLPASSDFDKLIGTWDLFFTSAPPGAPTWITYDADGTGTDSNGDTLTWVVKGATLTITNSTANESYKGTITWIDAGDFTYVFTTSKTGATKYTCTGTRVKPPTP